MSEITLASSADDQPVATGGIKPIYIICILFFVFGFLTWLNAVLITYLKLACQLNNLEAFFVAFAFYIAYFFMALPSTIILKKLGFKNSMAAGLVIIGVGAAIFIPAALTRQYLLFLLGLFVQGMGLAILQSASNPYITILGPIESAAKRISIMGIFNKVAGALGPIILGAIILADADKLKLNIAKMSESQKIIELTTLSHKVIMPYVAIVAGMIVLAIFIYYSTLPEINLEGNDADATNTTTTKTSIFQYPHLLLGVATLFLYVGAEVLAGDSIANYANSVGVSLSTSKYFATCTLCSMLAGYIVGIICIPRYFSQRSALKVSAIIGVVFSLTVLFTQGTVSVFFVAFLGIANALMWPALWPLAINGLGKFTKTGSSMLIMGIAGGGLIPLLYGYIADKSSLHQAYWIMVPIYLFILYYSVSGYKKGLSK